MGFMNMHDVLIMDNEENIYSFYMHEKKVKLLFYDKERGRADKKLIASDCLDEYDATISDEGVVYLVCQKIDSSIVLITIEKGRQEESVLAEEFDGKLRNLNITIINDIVHIIYCLESKEGNKRYRIFHHNLLGDNWNTNIVSDISAGNILNPISLVKKEDKLIIGYYDMVDNYEQVFVSILNLADSNWLDKIQLTEDNSTKLYLDMIINDKNEIDICYSKLVEGNFLVTHKKYELSDLAVTKVAEHALSNPSNCMYPTFIYEGNTLWLIWIEFNGLLSCYSKDEGMSWSLPFSWESSKKNDFARYKFSTNNDPIANIYKINYGFCTYGDDLSFIGFGDVENAIEVPLKSQIKKKEDEEDIEDEKIIREREVSEIQETIATENELEVIKEFEESTEQDELEDLKERVEIIEQALKAITEILEIKLSEANSQTQNLDEYDEKLTELEKRIFDVESYLSRRRGPLRR